MSRKAEIGNLRKRHVGGIEALDPLVHILVLDFEEEVVLLEIRQAGLCGDASAPNTANLGFCVRASTLLGDREKLTEHPASSVALPSWAWS